MAGGRACDEGESQSDGYRLLLCVYPRVLLALLTLVLPPAAT